MYAYGADALHLNVEVQPPDGTRFSELAAGPGDDEVMAGTQDIQILVYGPGLQLRARLPGQGDMPLALAGNVRSGVVAAVIRGRNDSVVLWPRGRPAIDGAPLRVEGRQHATVSELAISADGQTLFGSGIGFSALWDPEVRTPPGIPLPGHSRGPRAIASSRSLPLVATGSSDGEILLWNLDPGQWAVDACRMANRNLSCVEWRTVQGDRAWKATCPTLPAPEPACR